MEYQNFVDDVIMKLIKSKSKNKEFFNSSTKSLPFYVHFGESIHERPSNDESFSVK